MKIASAFKEHLRKRKRNLIDPKTKKKKVENDINRDNLNNASDTQFDLFEKHYLNPDTAKLNLTIQDIKKNKWKKSTSTCNNLSIVREYPCDEYFSENIVDPCKALKQRLYERLEVCEELKTLFSKQEIKLFILELFSYKSVLDVTRQPQNNDYLLIIALHLSNHLLKGRDRILRNNLKLSAAGKDHDLELRDQGFSRPRALIILPTRNYAYKFVNYVLKCLKPDHEEHKKRFVEEFLVTDDKISSKKPIDHQALFEGNTDDMFRIGIKLTRKSVKLYSKYDQSDFVVASALGLRTMIEEKLAKEENDFLSSIEILVIDQAEAIMMQNWEHIIYILEHLNRLPRGLEKYDFSRVLPWYLDENAQYLRQNIVTSSYLSPILSSLFNRNFINVQGRVLVKPLYDGIISQCLEGASHVFEKIDVATSLEMPEIRFKLFTNKVLPVLKERKETGTLIFVPSYFDYIRLKNYMQEKEISFAGLDEYSSTKMISRARTFFEQSRVPILLYSQRQHHFRRFFIKGVENLLMYSVPDNPLFYLELVEAMIQNHQNLHDTPKLVCRTFYTRYESFALERIIGSSRIASLLAQRYQQFEYS